jgi:DNA modification methylase
MQQKLFDTNGLTSGFRDPSFAKNKTLPLHRWVPWVAGFSSEFVDDCLDKYLPSTQKDNIWVLDPFAGVGTTLVEAYTHGLNVIGFEINPYAVLAARSKLEATKLSRNRLEQCIVGFERFMERNCRTSGTTRNEPRSQPPNGFTGRTQLFSPRVQRKILFVLDFISSITDSRIRELFRLALGSVMVGMSNYSYEPSLSRRSTVGKPNVEDAPVGHVLAGKLRLMMEDVEWLKKRMRAIGRKPQAEVIGSSFFTAREAVGRSGFIDLVVTSPPYLNNYHYPRNTRPQLHWLGLSSGPGYNGAGEEQSFGKFWQTVRNLPPVSLSFHFPSLEAVIGSIRRRNAEKGSYGGSGWANYVATYFNDTYRFCQVLASLLRPKGVAVIVLGNSVIQGVEVRTDYYFGKIAEMCGLSFEETILLRKKRTGTSIIQSSVRVDKAARKTVLYESGIILRK